MLGVVEQRPYRGRLVVLVEGQMRTVQRSVPTSEG